MPNTKVLTSYAFCDSWNARMWLGSRRSRYLCHDERSKKDGSVGSGRLQARCSDKFYNVNRMRLCGSWRSVKWRLKTCTLYPGTKDSGIQSTERRVADLTLAQRDGGNLLRVMLCVAYPCPEDQEEASTVGRALRHSLTSPTSMEPTLEQALGDLGRARTLGDAGPRLPSPLAKN